MLKSAHGTMRLPHTLVGMGLCPTLGTSMPDKLPIFAMLLEHTPGALALGMSLSSTIGLVVHVLEEFMLEAGATMGRNLRLEVCRISYGASRDRHGDMVWSEFRAPSYHRVASVTVTNARTNTSVPHIGAHLLLSSSLVSHGKLDADLRMSDELGLPSEQSVHD
jgi:hypothetical protein